MRVWVFLIHPILVRPLKNNKSEVVAGMRRYYAANDLKWESIECHSRELNDLDAIKIAFSENIKRENLNPIELGKMYKTYMEYLPQTETKNKKELKKPQSKLLDEVSNEFNVSESTVRTYISLLDLPKELRSLIILNHGDQKKGFGVSYGFELARLRNFIQVCVGIFFILSSKFGLTYFIQVCVGILLIISYPIKSRKKIVVFAIFSWSFFFKIKIKDSNYIFYPFLSRFEPFLERFFEK